MQNLPQHIAIIMDGNGRWAKSHGQQRNQGHQMGVESVKSTVTFCVENQIPFLTLFAFGKDNHKRPSDEINFIMGLIAFQLHDNTEDFLDKNIRIKIVGDRSQLNKDVNDAIDAAENATAHCSGLQLSFALNYCGRWDISTAAKAMAQAVEKGELESSAIDEKVLQQHLPSSCLPNVDLLIRTSGESRLSDFLLWQLTYSELYFTPISWPDFNTQALQEACKWFASRERRFGKISEQL